ncbi:unnamed protein product [Arctogadus glacialis]
MSKKRKATDIRDFFGSKRRETDTVESGRRQSQGENTEQHSQEQQAEGRQPEEDHEQTERIEIEEDGASGIGQQEDVEQATGTEQDEDKWKGWRERNLWLYCKYGKLGCHACREAKTLLLSAKVAGLMKDVLRELQSLSLKLQRRETSIVDSFQFVTQTVEVLTALKTQGGKSTNKAEQAINAGLFKGVSLIGEGAGKISKPQFIQSVVDNLNSRMPADELVKMLEPLEKSAWPENRADLVLYGEAEVSRFAK